MRGGHQEKSSAPPPMAALLGVSQPLVSGLNAVSAAKHGLFKTQERVCMAPWAQAFLGPLSLQLGSSATLSASTHTESSAPLFPPRTRRRARMSQPGLILRAGGDGSNPREALRAGELRLRCVRPHAPVLGLAADRALVLWPRGESPQDHPARRPLCTAAPTALDHVFSFPEPSASPPEAPLTPRPAAFPRGH